MLTRFLFSRRSVLRQAFAAATLSSISFAAASAKNVTTDVCVYGATPAGVAAAVAAARDGAKVALVEPMGLVGGIMSSGLSFSDSNQTAREALGGIFEEFHLRVEKHYQEKGIELTYKVADKDNKPWTNEPHVAEKIFNDLIREAGVDVYLNHSLKSAEKNGVRLKSMVAGDTTFDARVFIDTTYEGDLMAKAGVSSVIGREPAHQYGESLAGHQYPKKPQFGNPYDKDGKILPLVTAADAGDPTKGDNHIMVYSFRLCVTDKPENQVPFPKPANYDPAQFELLKRYLSKYTTSRQLMDFYPLPNGKTDVNNSIGGQLSLGMVGASDAWPEADEATRQKIWQAHKDYTLGLIYFICNDPSVPVVLRDDMRRWGLCKDEFTTTDNWPPVLYVREARRMQGEYLLTQNDILERTSKPDSIGVASFPIDSHDCQRIPTQDGGFINEGTIFPKRIPGRKIGQPYQVPYRSITPKLAECDNLLVPVCLSATHVALSSVRVEPTWIVLGQSAGVAGALAVKKDSAVQKLPYPELREKLIAQKQILDLSAVNFPKL